jgi:hypothetical protein
MRASYKIITHNARRIWKHLVVQVVKSLNILVPFIDIQLFTVHSLTSCRTLIVVLVFVLRFRKRPIPVTFHIQTKGIVVIDLFDVRLTHYTVVISICKCHARIAKVVTQYVFMQK